MRQRARGGNNAKKLGVCPAALPNKYDGVNNGKYGGRFCWVINKTTDNAIVDNHAKKLWECIDCNVLKLIQIDEDSNFIFSPTEVHQSLQLRALQITPTYQI